MKRRTKQRRLGTGLERLENRWMMHGDPLPHDHDPNLDPTTDFHIHADISFSVNGEEIVAPAGVGDTVGIHKHDDTTKWHIHPNVTNPGSNTEFVTLGDIMRVWREDPDLEDRNPIAFLDDSRLFNNFVDGTHQLYVFVNGIRLAENFAEYRIHDGDRIVIAYSDNPFVVFTNNIGTVNLDNGGSSFDTVADAMVLELLPKEVPDTVNNFLNYVRRQSDGYVNTIVHRADGVDTGLGVVQWGGFFVDPADITTMDLSVVSGSHIPTDAPIQAPFVRSNVPGTVAAAKNALGATSEIFLNLGDNSAALDPQDFSVFAIARDLGPFNAIDAAQKEELDPNSVVFRNVPYTQNGELVSIQSVEEHANDIEFNNSLGGFVYIDTDNDGVKDTGEAGLSEVTITLVGTDDQGNPVNRTIQTGIDGSYLFTNIRPGTYSLIETQPNFVIDGIDTIGTQGGDDSLNDRFDDIVVEATTHGLNNNFGEIGRSAQFALLADYIMRPDEVPNMTSRFDNSILVASSADGGQAWAVAGPGWDGFELLNVYVSPDQSQITLTSVNSSGQTQTTTLSVNDSRVTNTGEVNGVMVFRINGTSSNFSFTNRDSIGTSTPETNPNTFDVVENVAVGTFVGQITQDGQSANLMFEFSDPNRAADLNLRTDDHIEGDPTAPVVLIEYLSLQCPACADVHSTVEQLQQQFAGDILVVRRHLPLSSIFPNAEAAAIAAEAAGRQGMFDEMVDLLFERQAEWSPESDPQTLFEGYATELGLNLTTFQTDQADPDLAARVARDADAATNNLGLGGTPSFFLNGQQIANPANFNDFAALVQSEVDAADDVFSLNRTTGELFTRGPIDFETTSAFILPVDITNGATSMTNIQVNVTDVSGA